jgi:hypothetical protein
MTVCKCENYLFYQNAEVAIYGFSICAFIEVSFEKRFSLLCFIKEYGAGPVGGHGGALQPGLHALIALLQA